MKRTNHKESAKNSQHSETNPAVRYHAKTNQFRCRNMPAKSRWRRPQHSQMLWPSTPRFRCETVRRWPCQHTTGKNVASRECRSWRVLKENKTTASSFQHKTTSNACRKKIVTVIKVAWYGKKEQSHKSGKVRRPDNTNHCIEKTCSREKHIQCQGDERHETSMYSRCMAQLWYTTTYVQEIPRAQKLQANHASDVATATNTTARIKDEDPSNWTLALPFESLYQSA